MSTFCFLSSFSQVNVLYTSKAAGPITCKSVADCILAYFMLSPLARVNSSKCCLHCRHVLARLLLSRCSGSGGVNCSILTPCAIHFLSYSRTIYVTVHASLITTIMHTDMYVHVSYTYVTVKACCLALSFILESSPKFGSFTSSSSTDS